MDDGLATGITLLATIQYYKKHGVEEIYLAVPTGHQRAIKAISTEVDKLYCINVRGGNMYAVADAYTRWRDLSAEDVKRALREARVAGAPTILGVKDFSQPERSPAVKHYI